MNLSQLPSQLSTIRTACPIRQHTCLILHRWDVNRRIAFEEVCGLEMHLEDIDWHNRPILNTVPSYLSIRKQTHPRHPYGGGSELGRTYRGLCVSPNTLQTTKSSFVTSSFLFTMSNTPPLSIWLCNVNRPAAYSSSSSYFVTHT